jgi:D-3-phosphoglycerate dehydrogenase
MDKEVFANLSALDSIEVHPKAKNTQDEIKALLPKASALVIRSATKVTQEILDLAPNLKYVIRAGEGTDNIDKVACEKVGVKVSNTPGANNNSAAEHAIALMMTVLRKTAHAHQSMTEGRWDKALYTGVELAEKKVGIVGFGRIGQIVAKRLAGFDPKVVFFDPFLEKSELPYATKAKDLQEVFSTCDVITLHTPLMEETKGLINAELLSLMQPHAILVNASRGGIVNEDALLTILKDKKIRGAGFDVFAKEPLEDDSPLRKLDNLILTPHLGASTEEAQLRVGHMSVHQLQEFLLNDNLLNEVKA